MPDYLRGLDLTVLPCPINDYTRSMFPLKFFEYLAAGKTVVATKLDALAGYANVCKLCDSPEQFTEAIEQTLSGNVPDRELCLELARKHTWQHRLDQMLAIIEQNCPPMV